MSPPQPQNFSLVPRELIAREKRLLQNEWLAQTIRMRFIMVAVTLGMAIADFAFDVLPGSWQIHLAGSLLVAAVNLLAREFHQRDAARSWHFWALQSLDTLMIGFLVATSGALGYLGIPFFLVAASAYGLGLPRAARVQLGLACAVYPVARWLGLAEDVGNPEALVVLETLCMAAIGWLAIRGPIRHTYRVRRARRALGALELGDFEARLPTRAFDDLGFLGVSFNATAEALGNAVHALEGEVAERTRAEAALRDREQRLNDARHDATLMAERMAVLAHAAAGVIAADSARALRDVMLEACRRVIVLDDLAFALYDPASASLRFLTDSVPEGTTSIPVASTAYEQVISEKRSSVSVGILAAPDEEDTIGTSATQTLVGDDASVIRTPIIAGGEVLAVLAVRKRSWEPYASLDVEVLEALAAMAATALRNISLVDELRSSQEALSYQAHHDALTGLPNRSRFLDRVARALTNGSPERVCVLALDLDGFKAVNDTLGHAAGDRLLVETAERLQNATRGRDTVARLGGDEFAVLLEQVHDDAESEVVAERILRAMQAPFSFGDRVTVVGASIGIARGDSRESDGGASLLELGSDARSDLALRDPIDALLRNADVALYHAKTAGKGRFAFFDPSMNVAAVERTSLESGLRVAIESNALRLYYQPIIALDSDMVVGVEALLRWTHPERGPVPPSTFIPIAEETGLIVPIGRWVMEEACAQGARWQRRHRASYPGRPPLTISVNVSGRQLQEETFVDDVRRALRVSGLARGTLLLELTESTVVRQSEGMRERLAALKETGVQLAIDDFGTGYSALSYLQHFPIDVLKIDKSFVDGVARGGAQGTLARTIIALGEALSLRTIAEGIEHEDQRRCLQSMGCNLGQGYYFAHPLPAEGFDRYLAAVQVEAGCL